MRPKKPHLRSLSGAKRRQAEAVDMKRILFWSIIVGMAVMWVEVLLMMGDLYVKRR
jgi:hypothetical protein